MALFLSTYVNKVDRKGRVSVPATFRAALADQSFQGVILFPSFRPTHKVIEGCGMDRMNQLAAAVDQFNPFSDEQDDFATVLFSSVCQLPFDGEGRIVLPEHLCDYAGIAGQVAFVGRGTTFQIWRPEAFRDFEAGARERAAKARDRLRLPGTGSGA